MFYEDVLPSTTPRYEYEGIQHCLQILEQWSERSERESRPNPYLIFAIDERSFLECFVNSGESLLTKSWETYDHSSNHVLIKMQSVEHATAAGAFDVIFTLWAHGVRDTPLSSTSTRIVRGHTRTKRADSSWTPRDPPAPRSTKWPTLAVEVAWSEPRAKLQQDVAFWLNESKGEVKAALTITVRAHGRIAIEEWVLPTTGNTTIPYPNQKIEIVRNPGPNCPRIQGQLTLQFRDIFLRDKRGKETDFTLSHSDMEEIGDSVWKFQFNKG